MSKYRLWDKQDKRMIYAEEATNSKEVLAIGLHGLPIIVDEYSFKPDQTDQVTAWNVDDRMIPMQCMGVKDKNGKEIYVGDIITHPPHWHDQSEITVVEHIHQFCGDFGHYGSEEDIEVVGNLYETPQLAPKK
jgi:uncharacterized phage protein (TIGR01671 family)